LLIFPGFLKSRLVLPNNILNPVKRRRPLTSPNSLPDPSDQVQEKKTVLFSLTPRFTGFDKHKPIIHGHSMLLS